MHALIVLDTERDHFSIHQPLSGTYSIYVLESISKQDSVCGITIYITYAYNFCRDLILTVLKSG